MPTPALLHELADFLGHVSFERDEDVLVLDVELSQLEVKHFHYFFEVLVACTNQLGGLLQPKLDDVELEGEEVKGHDVELAFVH